MSKRQTRSATLEAKRRADCGDWQNTVMFVLKLVVLNKYTEIAKPCVALCRETWALPSGLSDEDAELVRKDNVFWPHTINEKTNIRQIEGYTRLHLAASKGYSSRITELVKWGANIEETTFLGTTPLIKAVLYNHEDAVRELLKLGANVDASSDCGSTALLIACRKSRVKIVKDLLAAGADVDKADFKGLTPIAEALRNADKIIKKMLIKAGADLSPIDDFFKRRGVY